VNKQMQIRLRVLSLIDAPESVDMDARGAPETDKGRLYEIIGNNRKGGK
jgi:hypothetical protein